MRARCAAFDFSDMHPDLRLARRGSSGRRPRLSPVPDPFPDPVPDAGPGRRDHHHPAAPSSAAPPPISQDQRGGGRLPSAARTATQISTPVLRGARLPSGGCCRVTVPGRSWDSSVTTRPTRRSEASSWTTAAIWFPPTTLGTRIKPPELMTASTVPPVGSFAPAGGLCSRIRPSGVWEGRIDCCPSRKALPSRAVAVSSDSPTRLGTVTNSGAANQTVTTASGGRNPQGPVPAG